MVKDDTPTSYMSTPSIVTPEGRVSHGYLWKDESAPPGDKTATGSDPARRRAEQIQARLRTTSKNSDVTQQPQQQQQQQQQQQDSSTMAPDTKVSLSDALQTVQKEDLFEVARQPCAKDGFLTGIGTGALVGGGRFVWRGSILSSSHWAVGGCLLGCIAAYEHCRYRRRVERVRMQRIVEIHQERVQEEQARQEQQHRDQAEQKAQKAWYRFW